MTGTIERLDEEEAAAAAESTRTIHERLVAILADLPAIGKDSRNPQQGFMFRSHDAVLNALNPLLGAHGVFVVPNVLERLASHRQTRSGSVMYEVNLHVEFTFYGLGGDYVVATTWGEGTDSGDKSTNKAMTMAFKNALNQVFAVSTEETIDSDSETPPETVRHVQDSAFQWERPETFAQIVDRLSVSTSRQDWLEYWIPQGIQILFGESKRGSSDLNNDERRLLFQRLSTVLHDLETADVTFVDRPLIQAAFAKVTNGAIPEGPPWRLSPREADLPTMQEYAAGATGATETPEDDEVDRLAEETITGPEKRGEAGADEEDGVLPEGDAAGGDDDRDAAA